MAPPKKSKPSLWQSLTHSPSTSYASNAPSRARKSSTTSSAGSYAFPRITSPSSSSFNSESNPNDGRAGWVHPSLRQAMKADRQRYEVVRSSDGSYVVQDQAEVDEEAEAEAARKKERRARKKRKAAEEEERQREHERQMHRDSHGDQPEFNLVKLESERIRQSLRAASRDGSQGGDRGEGSSMGGSVRERQTWDEYGSSPADSPRQYSPLEAPRRPSSHSPSHSYSSSNSGSKVSTFGSPSLGTVVEAGAQDEQQSSQSAYFNSSSRGGWHTSATAPPPPAQNVSLPPAPLPPRHPRRPSMSPHSNTSHTPPNYSPVAAPSPPNLGPPITVQALTPPDSEVGLGISMAKRDPTRAATLDTTRIGEILLERKPGSRRKSVAMDGASSDEDVFYTPRSSMYSIKSAASPEVEPPSPPRSPSPVNTTPVLTLQPPTPNEFPTGTGTITDAAELEAAGRDMFSEHSFHPDRVQSATVGEQRTASEPKNVSPPRKEPQARRASSSSLPRRDGSRPPSFVSSPLSYMDELDDAYDGLAYDDPPAPPRFPSDTKTSSPSSTGSSASSRPVQPLTPSSSTIMAPPISTNPLSSTRPAASFIPAHLRPLPRSRPGSVYSNVSTSSRYSQASYRSEIDAPPPVIIPSPTSSASQSPLMSPNVAGGQASVHSLGSFATSTPFLPRPTSTLLDSYEGYANYPSAPASVASDGAGPSRGKSVLSFGGSDVGSSGKKPERRASESIDGRGPRATVEKAASEVGGMSTVSTYRMPQVMGGAASLAEGAGTSLSGGSGYSTLTLPSGAYRPEKSPARRSLSLLSSSSRPLSVVGLPTTTISTLSLLSTPLLPSQYQPVPTLSISYTSHTPPPNKLSSSSVLVRIWAIALDAHDASTTRRAEKGWIPGRSWVGKVVECGDAKGGFTKGEWVYGLLPSGGGAAKEFVVVDRRWLAACPAAGREANDGVGMTLEDVASLPLLGVTAHRAVGGVAKGSRALVLLGDGAGEGAGGSDWGMGILACQELLARGVIVVLQVPEEWGGEDWVRTVVDNAKKAVKEGNVKVGEAVEVVHGEHEGSFDFVLDCLGGRRVYDASRRILVSGGQFTSTKPLPSSSDPTSTAAPSTTKSSFHSLRRTFIKKGSKSIAHTSLPASGSGPLVDAHGEDVRDVLEWIASTRPYRVVRVEKVVPFERGGEAFAVVGGVKGAGVGVKKGEWRGYACEEEVWGVRLVQ